MTSRFERGLLLVVALAAMLLLGIDPLPIEITQAGPAGESSG